MRARPTSAPRSEALGAVQMTVGDARHGTNAACDYTTAASPGISPRLCSRRVTWLRCRTCHASYCAAGAPGPQVCSDSARLETWLLVSTLLDGHAATALAYPECYLPQWLCRCQAGG